MTMTKRFAMFLLSTLFFAAACGTVEGDMPCSTDADCPLKGQVCDATAKVCKTPGQQTLNPDLCTAVKCPSGYTCTVANNQAQCTQNQPQPGADCTRDGCPSGQTCDTGTKQCRPNNGGGNVTLRSVSIEAIMPDATVPVRVVVRGSAPGIAGGEWFDVCNSGLPAGMPGAMTKVGMSYSCIRDLPVGVDFTLNLYVDYGNLMVSLPSRLNVQYGCYELTGDDARNAMCTPGPACYRSWAVLKVDAVVLSVPMGNAVPNGLGVGCNYRKRL